MTKSKTLRRKFEDCSTTVAVIGQGYVGLPLALAFARAGFDVIGIDIDNQRVEKLNEGTSYIKDVSDQELRGVLETDRFEAT
ncbi:MAG: 3-hydroxyacyl-CoA dehydrogenase NAD-binding domain-containing protein, partial [Bradymonadaceae bacterium]